MRITRKQFEKAQKDLPELKKAEQTIKTWQDALKAIGSIPDNQEIVLVERNDEGKLSWSVQEKDGPRVASKSA